MKTPISPPSSEAELLLRTRALGGREIGNIAESLGFDVPDDLRRKKGFVGQLCEAALGASASTLPIPDFPDLGIELKTIPISPQGEPLESTYICRLQLDGAQYENWGSSRVRKKLKRVLFVPVQGARNIPLAKRRFGAGFLWSPSEDEEILLRADWEDLVDLCARGLLEGVSARRGRFLQLRPKAANSRVKGRTRDLQDEEFLAPPRGFYLRRSFTSALLNQYFSKKAPGHAP